ncbi:Protein LURP-one-related 15 OS=Arabidopsis thaliana GN=At5g01750 PE=1 SV=1 [Rhizoctonia solani AG-1 IB]|uniref:Protein LURP-one-related 15 n=2 Tax=Rhizoctonia solani TaxID=456999 RepID=A0A8H3A7E5_9AGAM|nr:unnamed protein product [Rhizoctonia solani]CEL62619.1 Protein LURP-one-related 15 OS=Arabidopsis thaliana GN=At5g01750 PE=1 SV=1 [Rhizoctonia solani AG-1 IB]
MGSSSSTIEFSPLVPQNPPLGIMPAYAQNYELTLKLREKRMSLSGDSFEITDPQGRPYFQIEGSALSFREKKTLKQADGRPILNIQNKLLTIHRQYFIYNANESTDSEPLCLIKSHFSVTGAKLDVQFKNAADGRQVQFDLRGSFFDRNAEVTVDGQPVARISRQFMNSGQLLFDQQTYYLTVAPGVDAAMMVALCVCMDEKSDQP